MNRAPFTIDEIVEATRGILLNGQGSVSIEGVSTDSRYIREYNLFVAIKGDRFDGHDFIPTVLDKGVSSILISEKIYLEAIPSIEHLAVVLVEDTLKAYQAMARFHRRRFQIPVVAITGTNGKSTTKEMTASILGRCFITLKNEGNFNNHIGVPKTLLSLSEDTQVLVTEMGMNASGEIATLCNIAEPTIGVVTNVSMGHLEGLGSLEAIRDAKGELICYLDEEEIAILNADDKNVISLTERFKGKVVTFGIDKDADIRGVDISSKGGRYSFRLKEGRESVPVTLCSIGYHDIYNALAAAAVGVSLGIGLKDIKSGLEGYQPLAMRMEVVAIDGIEVINDAYNANPASMNMAIDTLNDIDSKGKKVLVVGDMLELGKEAENAHRELGRKVAASKEIDRLYTYGKLTSLAAESAIGSGMDAGLVISCDSHEDIVNSIDSYLKDGDILLVKGSRGNRLEEVISGLSKIRGDK